MKRNKNPYSILNVNKFVSSSEIQKAYRFKAKELHPDTNRSSAAKSEDFYMLNNAYKLLYNTHTRKLYDEGKIDSNGKPIIQKEKSNSPQQRRKKFYFKTELNSVKNNFPNKNTFSNINSAIEKAQSFAINIAKFPSKNINKTKSSSIQNSTFISVFVPFKTAIRGGNKKITFRDGHSIMLKIPAGVKTGQIIRIREQGEININGKRRDAMIRVQIKHHRYLVSSGDNILLHLPISLTEAVHGGIATIPTVDGQAQLKIPKGANSGQVLRLKGKGINRKNSKKAGDQLVHLHVHLPNAEDSELQKFTSRWTQKNYDPRSQIAI